MLAASRRLHSLGRVRYLSSAGAAPRTLFDKLWDSHIIDKGDDGTCLIWIDRHLVHEVTSPQAFEGLRVAGRKVRRPDCSLITPDHNVPTTKERLTPGYSESPESKTQLDALDDHVKEFDLTSRYFPLSDNRQGIVHIIGPEQGFSQPGITMVCGDSHTATHGAFGALAFGIGTSEVEHVLATQTLMQKPAKNMRITVDGELAAGVTSKDLVLHIIGVIGTAGGTGHVIEYAGEAVRSLTMESRMTVCNMSIEAGARAGIVAPDETTYNYLVGRPMSPKGELWDRAVDYWSTLPSDEGALYDTEIVVDAGDVVPQVTWGTHPGMVAPITASVPDPADETTDIDRDAVARALEYMGLEAGQKLDEVQIDKVFVGSCTNGRIEDLRAVAAIAKGSKVHPSIKAAMIVPGSGLVRKQAEEEGIADTLREAGFDFREPGCSMCLGMNADQLEPGERCASTSNRNFEGRQGHRGRTHLVSPAMAAAAAITGKLTDVRTLVAGQQRRGYNTATAHRRSGVQQQQRRGFSSTGAGMDPFTTLEGVAAPLPTPNIDTDMIVPARYLKTIKRTGLGVAAFSGMRYLDGDVANGERPEFVLNKAPFRDAKVLVTGENFGCGSSREHAPWALLDFGIKCVVAESFADIFFNNCFKNGILPVTLSADQVDELMKYAAKAPGSTLKVDLEAQTIATSTGEVYAFDVEPFRKHCLVNGLDDIGLTMQKEEKIKAYEQRRKEEWPWLESAPASV